MASPAATTPDTLVTLKVNYDGNPRRFKLPLHDLVATTLEGKLRTFLGIPTGTACTIERYSDSAATYVVLDPTVVSVYKQLYRAAKAKQKLKLRVTTKQEATESKMVPKPVTVEDEPEPSQKSTTTPDLIKIDDPVITPSFTAVPPRTSPAQVPNPILSATNELMLGKSIALAERGQKVMERNLKILEASVAKLNIDPSLKPNAAATRLAFDYLRDAAQKQTPPAVPKPPSEGRRSAVEVPVITTRANFTVCCNSCDNTIPDSHYHCATCDDGDFDLCQDCVDKGISCYGVGHWLIRRSVKNGVIISSITERIAPKPKIPSVPVVPTPAPVFKSEPTPPSLIDEMPLFSNYAYNNIRTCNSCVQELPDHDFVHCMTCDDYDLCKACFAKDQHGHHPKHAFVVVAPDSFVSDEVTRRLAAGRNQRHNAICDGCDKYIVGVRNKCLDCPDWDYCGECILNASFIHPGHRFVPVYEPIADTRRRLILATRAVHVGISCDGPLCSGPRSGHRFIRGERYKCAVCHDTDFCANCEASPANTHNPTHPLIKFKTPVRHVSVTTTGEHEDGNRMPTMGDRILRTQPSTSSRATETTATNQPIAATNVQTVVDVKPSEPAVKIEEKEIKEEATPTPAATLPAAEPSADELSAVYVKDTVADGTVMPPDHVFEQTWVLRNSGNVPWPAGCAVKYVGGDYMGHVDPKHPVAIQKLVSASESTVCYTPLAPNQSYPFTVLLRTPPREGKFISYWRLTTKEGIKFGHRLWCDVAVEQAKPVEEKAEEKKVEVPQTPPPAVEKPKSDAASSTTESSQMIFPKLEKESPVASIHEEAKAEDNSAAAPAKEAEDFEQCDEDDEWAEDDSDEEGVNTDEEYDILDASDEEPLDEHQK